jgi:hypothetical protein
MTMNRELSLWIGLLAMGVRLPQVLMKRVNHLAKQEALKNPRL